MYLYTEYDVSNEVKKKFYKGVKTPVVYIFMNKKDEILYIGKTTNFNTRWSQHIRDNNPITQVKTVVIMSYESESEASFAESQGIAYYLPKWNIHGKENTLSKTRSKWTDKVVLNVMTKQLNVFVQELYCNYV